MLPLTHLIFVSLWGGVLLSEVVLEISARDEDSARFAAKVHYWIDLILELPLILGVLTTGTLLALRHLPLPPLYFLKIGSGLLAIGFNLYCVGLVILRYRHREEAGPLIRYTRHIRFTTIGFLFGILSAILGLAFI